MMEDDCLCEYDSTWDTESDGDEPERRAGQDKNKTWTLFHPTPRNMRAAKDMQNYRRSYPNLTDDECSEDKMNNLKFYLNQFPSAPDDVYIESFHKEWKTDYKRLERVHSYIQWLFPLREPGVNYMASELTKKEIEAFKKSEEAGRRLVESYELMLGFYGMQLVNRDTGEVRRAENWKERFGNLERNMHNNLRITRILKSLGELGLEHYQAPLVHFFLEETLVKKTLGSVKRSVLDYFLFAVRDKQERQELLRFAYLHFEPKDKFVWCPRKIQKQLKRAEKRAEAAGNADGRDDVTLRAKGKDGEAGAPPKDEMGVVDTSPEAQKETDKAASGNKDKHSEGSSEPKPDAGTIGNGNAEAESEEEPLEDGSGCEGSEDVEEMDRSSPETMQTKPEANIDGGDSAKSKDPNQDPVKSAKPDGEAESEKPQKKKREDDDEVLPGNSSLAVDLVNGQTEESVPDNNPSGPTAPSASTPLKTKPEGSSKHLASPSSGRKIARTDFIHVLDNGKEGRELAQDTRVDQQEGASAPSRAPTSADHDQQEGASAPSRAPTSADHDQQEGASAPSRAPTSADHDQQEGASAPSRAPTSADTRVDQQEGASAPSRAPTSADTRVDQQEGASAPSRAPTSADYDQQANGKDSEEMDVESSLPTSNQDTGDS